MYLLPGFYFGEPFGAILLRVIVLALASVPRFYCN